MNDFISVMYLDIKATARRIGVVLIANTAVILILFMLKYREYNVVKPFKYYLDSTLYSWWFLISFLLVCMVLYHHQIQLKYGQLTTLRLKMSAKWFSVYHTIYNLLVFLFYWALQVILLRLMIQLYKNGGYEAALLNHQIYVSMYQNIGAYIICVLSDNPIQIFARFMFLLSLSMAMGGVLVRDEKQIIPINSNYLLVFFSFLLIFFGAVPLVYIFTILVLIMLFYRIYIFIKREGAYES